MKSASPKVTLLMRWCDEASPYSGPEMNGKIASLRAQAADCRRLAQAAVGLEAIIELLDKARKFDAAADRSEEL